jgi:hypothetical protein
MEGWNTTWLGMLNTTPMEAHKYHDVMNSQEITSFNYNKRDFSRH